MTKRKSLGRTIASPEDARKRRFRVALIHAGMTMEAWAAREGVTLGHVSHVLSGERKSRPLVDRIDAFSDKYAAAG